jgi:hypothetical protein
MKTNFNLKNGSGRILRDAVATAALLLLSGFAAQGQTAPPDPTTVTWDCVMSGPRDGLAYITFSKTPFIGELDPSGNNFSFGGTEILVPKAQQFSGSQEARNNGGDATRTGTTPGDTNSLNGTQIFGSEDVVGPWNFDSQGRMVGYFIEISKPVCTTNVFPISTNGVGLFDPNEFCVLTNVAGNTNFVTVCYTNQLICKALTNALSFVGKVVTGKRLTLVAATPFGHVTFRGVPMVASLTNISGSWFGVMKKNGQTLNEFFTLSGSGPIYDVMGAGPGYAYTNGVAILSSQKKIGFSLGFEPNDDVVRAVVGPFNSRKINGSTHGLEGILGGTDTRIRFDATRLALPPAE